MIKSLLFISIAPVLIIAMYIYIRDKYEKEPLLSLIKALITGAIIVLPILLVEDIFLSFGSDFEGLVKAFYTGFIVASFSEEGFKFVAFLLFFWSSRNFNEKFDGIVYAVLISLGFAAIENIIYVYKGGYHVGIVRAVTAVPAHAFFGIVMGYHFANARFYRARRSWHLLLAFLIPFTWHGLYDFLLMAKREIFLVIFIPLIIWFWIYGFRKIKELSMASVFRNDLFTISQRPENKTE